MRGIGRLSKKKKSENSKNVLHNTCFYTNVKCNTLTYAPYPII